MSDRKSSIFVLGVPSSLNHDEVDAALRHSFPDFAIGEVKLQCGRTAVTFEKYGDGKRFREQLPFQLRIGSHDTELSLDSRDDAGDAWNTEADVQLRGVCFDCDQVNTWQSLRRMPEGGKKGILIQDYSAVTSLLSIAKYFQSLCGSNLDGISHILALCDGLFVVFHDESVAESVLKEGRHFIDGHEVIILPKFTPEYWKNKFLIKASTDLKATYLKEDLCDCFGIKRNEVQVEKLDDRIFSASVAKGSPSKGSKLLGVSQFSPLMKTDCLMITSDRPLEKFELAEFFSTIGNPLTTKRHNVDRNSFLLYFSYYEDAEGLLNKYEKAPIRLSSVKVSVKRYLPELHGLHKSSDLKPPVHRTTKWPGDEQKPIEAQNVGDVNVFPVLSNSSELTEQMRQPNILVAKQMRIAEHKMSENVLPKCADNKVMIDGIDPNCNKAKLKTFLESKFLVQIEQIVREENRMYASFLSTGDAERFHTLFCEEIEYSFGEHKYTLKSGSSLIAPSSPDIRKPEKHTESYGILDADAIHTWYSRPPEVEECNKIGILVTPEREHPDKVIELFQNFASMRGGRIESAIPMIDGILLTGTFGDKEDLDVALSTFDTKANEETICVFSKKIPEYFLDKLLMKNTPKTGEEFQKLALENCSSQQIRPRRIQQLGDNESLIEYDHELDLQVLEEIISGSERNSVAKKFQLSLLPKSDCLEVEMVKGDDIEDVQPILENARITGGGRLTRFDKIFSNAALVYFTDYKDVEAISSKFEGVPLTFQGAEFSVKPYYHCFSNKHNRFCQLNPIDEYYRKYLKKVSGKEFLFSIQDEKVWKFLLNKCKNFEKFKSFMARIARVTLSDSEPTLIFLPLLFSDGSATGRTTKADFEPICFSRAQEFISKFSSFDCDVDTQKLAEVRKMKAHRYIAEDYDASESDDISVRWSNNIAEVVGLEPAVESFRDAVKQIIDITSESMSLTPAKYRWLMKTKVFDDIVEKYRKKVDVKSDNESRIVFSGPNEKITEMKLDILSHLEKVEAQKLTWNDSRITFLLKNSTVSDEISRIFQEKDIKGILYVTGNAVSVLASESQMKEAVDTLEESLGTEDIPLESDAHLDVTELDGWKELVRKAQEKDQIIVQIHDKVVKVAGFLRSVQETVTILEEFVTDNLEHCKVVEVEYIKACHFMQFHHGELQIQNLKWYLDHSKKGIALIGTTRVLEEATVVVVPVLQKIKVQDHQIDRPAIVEYFLSNRMEIELTARNQNSCTILVEKFSWPTKAEGHAATHPQLVDVAIGVTFGFLKVQFLKRMSMWDDSDAVVCLIGKNDHTRGRRLSLSDEIWVESVAGNKTKRFLHVSSPNNLREICGRTTKLLDEAEKLKCTTVSMPTLLGDATTEFGAAEEMLKGFKHFAESRRTVQCLKQVFVLTSNVSKVKDVVKTVLQTEAGAQQLDEGNLATSQPLKTQTPILSDDESCSSSAAEEEIQHQPPPQQGPSQVQHQSVSAQTNNFGSLKVSVRQGDITDDSNDIIVNSIGPSFKLTSGGAVSKIIERKGGSDIQKELSASSQENKMRVTNGGKLKCRKIIHVDALSNLKNFESFIIDILRKANDMPYSSISIPAIGTGGLGVPATTAAKTLTNALMVFSKHHHQPKNLKVVDLVLYETSMVSIFQSHLTPRELPTPAPKLSSNTSRFPINVSVTQGSITDENTDLIVNSLGNDFNLGKGGALSKEILRKGGQDIQNNLTQASGSQIRATKAGNLTCKSILHAATPRDVEKLKDLMVNILNEADKLKANSLSIPAIGTGGLGFKPSKVAEQLFAGMREFCSRQTPQYLKDVKFVVYEQKMVQDFETQRQKITSFPYPLAQNQPKKTSDSWQIGSLQVTVRLGDITQERNDMILNSLGSEFELLKGGTVSKKILQLGGSKIQHELSAGSGSEIRVTTGGNLQCKKILHLATPKDIEKLKKAVLSVLSVADDEKCSSISIPALATGGIGISSLNVAKVLFEQICKFSSKISKHLKVIDIVIYQQAMLVDFQNQFSQTKASSTARYQDVGAKPKRVMKAATKIVQPRKMEEKSLVLDAVQINVCKGKITGRRCDVIIHKTNHNFDLFHGNFPRHIYGSCKNEMKQEISQSSDKFLRETSCGVPIAKKIFHVVLPKRNENDVQKAILRIFNEVTQKGYNSLSLMCKSGKKAERILNAAVDFNRENANKRYHLTVNLFGNDFKALYSTVIGKGRGLQGAKIKRLETVTQDSIHLRICGHDDTIAEAINQIENRVKSSYQVERIPCDSIEIVEQRRWEEILDIGDSQRVKIGQSKERNGNCFITIEGIRENVLNASVAVNKILSQLSEAENVMKLGNYFWQYQKVDEKNWETFQAPDSMALEELYQGVRKRDENEDSLTMFVDGEQRGFEIDLNRMQLDGYRIIRIRREVTADFPKTWSDMGSKTTTKVELQTTDQEYRMVAEKFLKTENTEPRTILSITRLQNKMLHQVFESKKVACKKHCRTEPLSRYLFHGTKPEIVPEICKVGFDRIFAGSRVGAIYGSGNYFAVDADYPANKGYASKDSKGECYVFLAEVITGDFCKGKPGMKSCPKKIWAEDIPYESLVDNTDNPKIFVAFHDAGAYPSYIIRFKL